MASRAFREVVRAACWPPLPLRNVGRPFHRPAPKISTQLTLRRVTPTIPHLGAAKAIGLLYLYIVGLMVIVRISYGYGNPWVGSVINNTITELTLTPVACGAIRYANWGLSGRDAHKNFVGAHLPFPFFPSPSSLLFFLPLFPHFFPDTATESAGVLKLVSGRSRQTTFSEFWAERLLLVRTILVIITLYVCSPLGCNGLKCRPCRWPPGATSPLRTPSRRHCLPSCRTLPPFGQYQIIPHCLCVNNLPRVIT